MGGGNEPNEKDESFIQSQGWKLIVGGTLDDGGGAFTSIFNVAPILRDEKEKGKKNIQKYLKII